MKKLVIVVMIFYTSFSSTFFFSGGHKTTNPHGASFKTRAAIEAYNDCMNGASGDSEVTGCKSKRCRRDCQAIGEIVDKAKAEGVYPYFSKCVFYRNRRNDTGHWGAHGCHIRDKACWNRCYKEAGYKAHHHTSVQDAKKPVHKSLFTTMSICAKPWFSCKELE